MSEDEFMEQLVQKLGICLTTPEESIIKQGEYGVDMYFISQGDCTVDILDHNGKTNIAIRLLCEGHHFGEIALLYNCKRSCTIISRNYNTIARLTKDRLRMLASDFPDFKKYLIKHVFKYKDPLINFLKDVVSRVKYMNNIRDECKYEILFSMERILVERGSLITEEGK